MIDFGFDKIALIGAVALIVIGPEKLPKVARTVGHLFGKAQRYVADVKAEVNRSIELDELKKMKTQFEDAARDVEQTVRSEVNEANDVVRQRVEQRHRRPHRQRDADAHGAAAMPHAAARLPATRRRTGASSAVPRRSGTSSARHPHQGAVGRGARGALPAAGRQGRSMSDKGGEKPDELEGTEAPFVSHLIELRDRLIRAVIAIGSGLRACWRSGPGPRACTTCWPRRWWRTCPRARR